MTQFDTTKLRQMDYDHYLHPFSDMQDLKKIGTRIIVKGEGCYIWDSEGNKILDSMSGMSCVNMGYSQQSLIDAANEQLTQLPFYTSFFKTATPPAIELAALLSEIAPPGYERVFFTNSGSEANDTLVRMIRRYWDIVGKPNKKVIITRWNSYHGSTIAAASMSGMPSMHEQDWIPIPGIVHIDQPYQIEHGLPGESEADFALRAASWLEDKIKEIGADNIAAFVGEPVQMAGGAIIPPSGYWKKIQEICKRYDILLVSDDVICSFGRVGTWFGFQHPHIDFEPDLIVFAKAVTNAYFPLAGVIVGKRVGDVLVHNGGDFNHGFTYSGHPVGAAVGIATIRLMQESNILHKLQTSIIPYFNQAFMTLNDHPLIDHAQTFGMMAGFALYQDKAKKMYFPPENKMAAFCQQLCYQHGVVMRPSGTRMACAPPLIIEEAQIDEMIVKIRRTLDATLKAVG